MISIERCISVLKPLHLRRIVTPGRIRVTIIATWLYGIANGLPLYLGMLEWETHRLCIVIYVVPKRYIRFIMCQGLVFLTILTIIYCFMFGAIHRHEKKTQKQMRTHQAGAQSGDEIHILKALFSLIGVCILSWVPCVAVFVAFCGMDQLDTTSMEIYVAVSYILQINSAANPIIYALRIPKFRLGFKQLFYCSRQVKKEVFATQCKVSDTVIIPEKNHGNISIISAKKMQI